MPVRACAIILQIVLDSDDDSISPIGFDSRSRELPVYGKDWSDTPSGASVRFRTSKLYRTTLRVFDQVVLRLLLMS